MTAQDGERLPLPIIQALTIGRWRFIFVPDGDDPGVGTVTWLRWVGRREWAVVAESSVDAITREEFDSVVAAETLK